jgi:hypothetical protein
MNLQKKLLFGFWRFILKAPPSLLEKRMQGAKRKFQKEMAFMTAGHRRIHHLIVRELPGHGGPMPADFIAERAGMAVAQVRSILKDLDEHMTFICRNRQGEVVWAYPVTVEKTPHRVTLGSGEQVYAA